MVRQLTLVIALLLLAAGTACVKPESAQESTAVGGSELAAFQKRAASSEIDRRIGMRLPELKGAAWLNSKPLKAEDLEGKAVLLDIWDYTCVNCIRTLPYIKQWHERYKDKGLVIIGVHAPEFPFATEVANVRRAVEAFGLEYPIVLDNDFAIWQSLGNSYWPAKYFFDRNLRLRSWHFGEGGYEESERGIQALLREIDPDVQLPEVPRMPTGGAGEFCALPVTPELYLGYARGRLGNRGGHIHNASADYVLPEKLEPHTVYLEGPFEATSWSVKFTGDEAKPGRLLLDYEGMELNLVLHPPADGPGKLIIAQDGASLDKAVAGEQVSYKDGRSIVIVDTPRMYNLARNQGVGRHQLELVWLTPGLEGFAFTFTSCP
jgi:thiol-disulfide isomerase/thioredoxin